MLPLLGGKVVEPGQRSQRDGAWLWQRALGSGIAAIRPARCPRVRLADTFALVKSQPWVLCCRPCATSQVSSSLGWWVARSVSPLLAALLDMRLRFYSDMTCEWVALCKTALKSALLLSLCTTLPHVCIVRMARLRCAFTWAWGRPFHCEVKALSDLFSHAPGVDVSPLAPELLP